MSIEEDLRTRLTAAIRAKDLRTANIIRMINTKVMERVTSGETRGTVDDALVLEVVAAYKKMLDKAKPQYEAAGEAGRTSLEELNFETEFCAQFLPKQISAADLADAVKKAVAEAGKDPKMAGRIVGAVMKQYKGLVDAADVKAAVDRELTS